MQTFICKVCGKLVEAEFTPTIEECADCQLTPTEEDNGGRTMRELLEEKRITQDQYNYGIYLLRLKK